MPTIKQALRSSLDLFAACALLLGVVLLYLAFTFGMEDMQLFKTLITGGIGLPAAAFVASLLVEVLSE